MNLLDNLWKSATTSPDGKYENLIGKQCVWEDTPVFIIKIGSTGCVTYAMANEGIRTIHIDIMIQKLKYLDDSEEGVKELFMDVFNAGCLFGGDEMKTHHVRGHKNTSPTFDQWLLTKEAEQTTNDKNK